MKTDLSHLPQHKQDELRLICDIIREEVDSVAMIILFGSYARGGWVDKDITVDEDGVTHEFRSDFDILAITRSHMVANRHSFWDKVKRSVQSLPITWLNVIAHDINEVNGHLEKGQYFFSDIKKEGILLYNSGEFQLAQEKSHSPEDRASAANGNFKHWMVKAKEAFDHYEYAMTKKQFSKAAFELHQATENLYTTINLVFTNYKPRTHNLDDLSRMAAGHDPAFLPVFPRQSQTEKEAFKLLNKAYVDARYKRDYKITPEQLNYLAARIQKLMSLTEQICQQKINTLGHP